MHECTHTCSHACTHMRIHTYTHMHTHTHVCMHTQMPVSPKKWHVSVGPARASRPLQPCCTSQPKKSWISWDIIFSKFPEAILLPGDDERETEHRSEYSSTVTCVKAVASSPGLCSVQFMLAYSIYKTRRGKSFII